MRGLLKLNANLKILFLTYTHSKGGGGEAVLTTLVNNLPSTWKIDILEVMSFDIKKEPINKNIRLLAPLTRRKDHTKFYRFFNPVLINKPQIVRSIYGLKGYDVVISWIPLYSMFLLPAFEDAKRILWFLGMIEDLPTFSYPLSDDYYEEKVHFNIKKNVLKCADSVLVMSRMCLRCLNKVFSESSKKSKVLYSGTPIENIIEHSEEKIANSKLLELFQKEEPALIVIGRLDRNKNFSLALEAVKILKMRGVLCRLIVLGFETPDVDLHQLATSLDIKERVFFLGYQQNPLPFLARSKLLLITSFSEGFPTVATEAMSLGVPFVTTPVSGASEELANNGSCGLVSDWNATEYADKIEKLITDKELYQKMSKNCKEHIKNYSVENFVKSFKKELEEVPKKNKNKKIKRKDFFLNLLLFIFYSSFYLAIDNKHNLSVLKAKWFNFIHKPSILNFYNFFYRFAVNFIFALSFPFFLLMSSFLILKNLKDKEI